MAENRLSLFLAWELCVWLQNPFLVEVYFVVLSFHFIKALHIVQYNVCNAWQSITARGSSWTLHVALYKLNSATCDTNCTVQAGRAYG